jgi:hypothetical protein
VAAKHDHATACLADCSEHVNHAIKQHARAASGCTVSLKLLLKARSRHVTHVANGLEHLHPVLEESFLSSASRFPALAPPTEGRHRIAPTHIDGSLRDEWCGAAAFQAVGRRSALLRACNERGSPVKNRSPRQLRFRVRRNDDACDLKVVDMLSATNGPQ